MRSGLKTLILSRELGGTANSIVSIENWPGFSGSGHQLMKMFYEQLKKYPIEASLENVQTIEKKGKDFFVKTEKREIQAKSIIIATGTKRRNLKIPGEEKFVGRGISYCVSCDGFFFKERDVAFIAKEDCGSEEILPLAKIARKVYVVTEGKNIGCREELKEAEKNKKIEVITNASVKEILGKEKVEGLMIREKKGERKIDVDGIFIEMGALSLTEFMKKLKLKLDKENNIIVDGYMNTSVPGVFAAGDVTNSKVRQVLVASSQGAVAAKSVSDWLREE
jgi:thioredoxin reductase (NADPH)